MLLQFDRNKILIGGLLGACAAGFASFLYLLSPMDARSTEVRMFSIARGSGFKEIAARLEEERFIRSSNAFKILALVRGKATQLKPGRYQIYSNEDAGQILERLVGGSHREASITIPEGSSVYDIDALLSEEGILPEGAFAAYALAHALEGKLFPDTYKFFSDSEAEGVAQKFLDNFSEKALPALLRAARDQDTVLTLASLLEKEVPDFEERKIVAGLLRKRVAAGIPLQVDATVCYAKRQRAGNSEGKCHPLQQLDLKIDSPYNTYLYSGWPPGPIASPGILALEAALAPKSSPYWFYLSDPRNGKTIFARTLEEHSRNKALYLR